MTAFNLNTNALLNNKVSQPNAPSPFLEENGQWIVSELYGYTVQAKNGQTGKVHDFYFDRKSWAVCYLVVDLGDWVLDTGQWISGQKVIVPMRACSQPFHQLRLLPLSLPKELVKLSPTVEMFFEKWPDKPSVYSFKEVTGNHIKALDGNIGHVEDFIINTKTWDISLMVVDTKNWWPAKKVIVQPFWINKIDNIDSTVIVDLPQEFIKNSPVFNRKDILKPETVGQ